MMLNFQGYLTLLSNLVTICFTTSACNGNFNLNGIKKLYHDRCVSDPIIGDGYGQSLLDCVENCLITKGCLSIQYSRASFRCLKSSKTISTDAPKEVCRGEVSSAREHWTEGFPDPCQSADCLTGSLCKFDIYRNVSMCEMPVTCELHFLNRLNWKNVLDDCDAYGLKVRFMSKKTLQELISLDNVCTSKDKIVVRLKNDSKQKQVVLAQHSNYSSRHSLTFLINNHTNFAPPQTDIKYYFYLGFLPISTARSINATQGYRANDQDFQFQTCDNHANSYIVFYTGNETIPPRNGQQSTFMMGWINKAYTVTADRYLPDDYFMQFEMHMGGCGGLMTSPDFGSYNRAAVGCVIGP